MNEVLCLGKMVVMRVGVKAVRNRGRKRWPKSNGVGATMDTKRVEDHLVY